MYCLSVLLSVRLYVSLPESNKRYVTLCQIVHSHGGQRGSQTGQYNGPVHVAVDDNEAVFVADYVNGRVTLLSPTLNYVREVVSPDKLNGLPSQLCFGAHKHHLYIADNEVSSGKTIAGRVVVFRVQ